MKHKIAVRLTVYFAASLLLFSVVIGGVFLTLFARHTVQVNRDELEKRAVTMADTLSGLMSGGAGAGMGMGGMGGYGAYLRFLDDIAMADVWIVDENLNLITGGMSGVTYNYADLPSDAETVVTEAFQGGTTFSEGFSALLNTPTLTVGTPIEAGGRVLGVLLLHASVEGMNEASNQGIRILLLSMAAALFLSVPLSLLLALSFTRPLRRMKTTAVRLADGDYAVKTGVARQDELGQLAEAIDRLSEQLDSASRERENLDRLRREFMANVSHELRTPVTVLRGSLEALCDGVVTGAEQVEEYHRQLLGEAKYLQRLVNDLLELTRLQSTGFRMEMEQINLCEVLQDALRSAGQLAREKGIELRQDLPEEPEAVTGDYGRLRQMFLIVLDNAIKFSAPSQSVEVRCANRTVTVSDHGKGITPETLEHIFDRFYTSRSEENKEGTGLGLAIAKQIADRHGAAVRVRSEPGKGTQLEFQF